MSVKKKVAKKRAMMIVRRMSVIKQRAIRKRSEFIMLAVIKKRVAMMMEIGQKSKISVRQM